ncbi:Cell division activator CedA [compost metagenome]
MLGMIKTSLTIGQGHLNARREGQFSAIIVKLFINLVLIPLPMKPLRQPNTRPVITYQPRVEPVPPAHAWRVEGFKDVWMLRNRYVAFVLVGNAFRQSPPFTLPEAAQRWAMQVRHENEIS